MRRSTAAAPGPSLLNYSVPQGVPALRSAMEQFLRNQGLICAADNLLITSGGMEALSLSAWMVLQPGESTYLESSVFMMHPGMDGPHDYGVHLRTNGPQTPGLVFSYLLRSPMMRSRFLQPGILP